VRNAIVVANLAEGLLSSKQKAIARGLTEHFSNVLSPVTVNFDLTYDVEFRNGRR